MSSLGCGLQHLLDLGGADVLAEQFADDRAGRLGGDVVDALQRLGLGVAMRASASASLAASSPSIRARSLSVRRRACRAYPWPSTDAFVRASLKAFS